MSNYGSDYGSNSGGYQQHDSSTSRRRGSNDDDESSARGFGFGGGNGSGPSPSGYGQQPGPGPQQGGQYPPQSGPYQGGRPGPQGSQYGAPRPQGSQYGAPHPQGSQYGGQRPQGAQYGSPGPQHGGPRPPQQQYGSSAGPQHGGNMPGSSEFGGNMPGSDYSSDEVEKNARNAKYKDWAGTAGKVALGALAAGAVAYGVHEYVEDKNEDKERKRREEEDEEREDEERRRRREEAEKRRRDEENRPQYGGHHQQGSGHGGGSCDSPGGGSSAYPPNNRNSSSNSSQCGRRRDPNPDRSSVNSPTPRDYPQLRQNASDTTIKIGTLVSLKHNMTGRFLHSDRSHSTQTGSNQQLVFGFRWNPDQNDWWQVLPANRDVPVPGQTVTYGTQIRLRHVETGRHLHSHFNFQCPKSGQNEVTAFGDSGHSDENDHWVVERWGDGGHGQTWSANDVVIFRHYISGMALHSHDILIADDVQSVTCFGPGREENDKWRVHLTA